MAPSIAEKQYKEILQKTGAELASHEDMLIQCPSCKSQEKHRYDTRTIYRVGWYYRKSDGQHIQRYFCRLCKKHFSKATLRESYRQNKRHKNDLVSKLLNGLVSQREAARILNLNRKTIVRKFVNSNAKASADLRIGNLKYAPAREVEFDDLETYEGTKCKPLSVSLMVESKSRRILGVTVSRMPAKGHLARKSQKKYGNRQDERAHGRDRLFSEVKDLVDHAALVRSDSNPHYPNDVKKHFPKATHVMVLGRKPRASGQGELKKGGFDPIFSLNHTCAMLRANVNRLIRETWCTTKRAERLEMHLRLYAVQHNRRIDAKIKKKRVEAELKAIARSGDFSAGKGAT